MSPASSEKGPQEGAEELPRNPDKVLVPPDVTKAELAAHYRAVSDRMLPELRGRPLMLERHPDGADGPSFMQKHIPDHYPDWVHRATVPKEGGEVTHVLCEDERTCVYLVDQGCTTLHRWLARADRPHHPDRMVFDLDPPDDADGDPFELVRSAAHRMRELLAEIGLQPVLMTTGSRGLHVIVPLDRRADADEVLDFAHRVADTLAERHSGELTTAPRKDSRRGRLYLDVQRNGYAQTAVAPYSVRFRPGGPVATPLHWAELDDSGLRPDGWKVADFAERRVAGAEDPWEGAFAHPRGLGPAGKALEEY